MQGVCSTYIYYGTSLEPRHPDALMPRRPDAPSNPPKRKGGSGEYGTTILYHYRTSGGTI